MKPSGKSASTLNYGGKERRVHRIFVTRNTEYHTRKGVCVRVRDRRSGQWMPTHLAVNTRVIGGLRFHLGGDVLPNSGIPSIGESMLFETGGRDLVTSTVVSVERPSKELAASYAA